MTLPGFTAEASLRRTDLQYRADRVSRTPPDNDQVTPQFGPRLLGCDRGTFVSPNGSWREVNCCYGLGGLSFCYYLN